MRGLLRSYLEKNSPAAVQSMIARRILFYILLFSSCVTLLTSVYQLYSDYREQVAMVDQRMVQIERSYRDSLGNAIWFFNAPQIDSILKGVMEFEGVHYVGVRVKKGDIFDLGQQRTDENVRRYDLEVLHTTQDHTVNVGHLSIESNLDSVFQRLGDKFWLIFLSQAIKTFFVSIFILFIVHYLVTRHLSTISSFAANLDIEDKERFLGLERKPGNNQDELDKIANAINLMKKKLINEATARERASIKLNTLSQAVEQSSVSVLILDTQGNIEYVNRHFERSTGIQAEDILGTQSDDLCFGEATVELHREIWRVISSGKNWRGELQSKHQNGSLLWEVATVSSIRTPDNQISHYLISRNDISKLKKIEQDLRHSKKMEAVDQLTGGIAHDFNNILGVVMGNLELLQLDLMDNESAQKRIDKALSASQRAAELTSRLLQFSRKDAGEVSQLSVNDFISNVEELITKSLTVSIKVTTRLSANLWPVAVNSGDLEDTILNLSLNARDAMPNGGSLLIETQNIVLDEAYVDLHPECSVGEFVMLSVSDTGKGMTDEVKEHAMHPFFTTKEQGKGTGLGLSMVYGFIQRSGGFLSVYSELEKGTVFKIFIPKGQAEVEHSMLDSNDVNLRTGTETVLVVEDELGLREIACTYLEQLGYKVLSASNAQQALDILQNHKTLDVLFSDVIMPGGVDGYQLAHRAKKLIPLLKVLLTSGFNEIPQPDTDDGCEFIQALTANTLNKPYNKVELAAALSQLLDNTA